MSFSPSWLRRALRGPATSWVGVASGLIFAAPSLGVGFFADDYWMLNALDGVEQNAPPWYDLYRFVDRAEAVELSERGLDPSFIWNL
jgi:hypothetical protein